MPSALRPRRTAHSPRHSEPDRAPVQRRSRVASPPSSGEKAVEFARNLGAESHVRAIALWVVLSGVLGLVALLFLALLFGPVIQRLPGGFASLPAFLAVAVGLLGSQLVVGLGLWRLEDWAAGSMMGLCALWALYSLYNFAAGGYHGGGFALLVLAGQLGWHGLVAFMLYSNQELFAPSYRRLVARSSASTPFRASPFFWVPFGIVALLLLF
jgi:hypothetical protein